MPSKAAGWEITSDLKCSDILPLADVDTGFCHLGWSCRESRWNLADRRIVFILRSSLPRQGKPTAEGAARKTEWEDLGSGLI